ncbi:peptidyl-tRNA hydrolase [Leptolyngbya valderiana BDU 20041]|nr:peptidyl-tRNA hydrolase [Leptolyngbya valderiana BDU 20041]
MHLIAGLGNPGDKYAGNRHNAGFMVLDAIAERWAPSGWRARFQGLAAEALVETANGREKVLLLKPQTYYNESGRAIGEAARFYKIPSPMVTVFHDELDLAPGKFRLKTGGGHAGNNGLRSTMAHLDGDFKRGRIGIGHPGDKAKVTGWVLSDFPKAETWIGDLADAVARALPHLVEGADDAFQTKVTHLAPAPKD